MWSKILPVSSYDLHFWKKFQVNFLLRILLLLAFIRFSDAETFVRIYNESRDNYHNISINNGPLNSTFYNSSCINLLYTFGFNGKTNGNTTNTSMDGMLHYKKYICCANVLMLDWSEKASTPDGIGEYATKLLYPKVVQNAVEIGNQLAKLLLYWAANFDFKIACLHLIGHSLGAHLLGYAGKYVNREGNGTKIHKITGLDPAGGLFGNLSIVFQRLNENDATKVEYIHTDATSNPETSDRYGINETVGFDFWLNYYTSDDQVQPGCMKGDYPFLSNAALCSHNRAPEVFAFSWRYQTCCFTCVNGTIQRNQVSQNETESQTPTFQASGASNYYAWAAGNSSSSVVIIGACVNCSASGNHYLWTTGTYPYAKGVTGAFPP